MKVPQNRLVVSCPVANGCPGASTASATGTYFYLFKYFPKNPDGPPELTGKDLQTSGIRADIDPQTNQWVTLLSFTGHGSKQFQKITKAEYQRGQATATLAGAAGNRSTAPQYAGHSAIVLDGVLESTPYIDFTDPTLQNGIAGGAQISTGSQSDAKNLALILQTGALPYNFQQIERTDVSSTLGKDSLTQAWHAALVGLIVVAIFLLLLYRFLGLVAVFGLAIYAALYYAAILLFNVTLTLPGFAGLILTIGVAADANVVVFERIKEEVRSGKSVRAAISAGYGKGFHTILDANVVTAITALVLFLIAVASVKGFALMLLIGTAISLLTAVAATRAMLGLLSGFRWFDNPRFMGAHGQQTAKWLQIDFMRRRYLWFAISGVIIVAGAASLGVRGLNLGIDFKGGTQLSFKTHTAQTTTEVRRIAAADGQPDAVVQGTGTSVNGKYTSWQVRTKSLKGAQLSTLTNDYQRQVGAYATGSKDVSSSFGHQIAIDAIWGILVSLALIIIYIALRFDIKFAVPVIVAMIHDILITVGLYSLVFKEVTIDTVAAVLTVLGYSIYDTIIIFDRIRENVPLMRRQPFATIANVSSVGDDQTVAGDDVHHAAPDRCARGARRLDAEGLRVRAAHRRDVRRVLVDLHRGPTAHDLEGARARVRPPQALHRGRRAGARRSKAPGAAADAASWMRARSRSSSRSRRSPTSRRRSSSTSSPPRRRNRPRRRGARSASSAAGRGRTAVPASPRIVDALEELLNELPARVRGSRARFGEQTVSVLRSLVEELNLVTRDDLDELELRVAQLEHRLRLLEERHDAPRP